MATVKIKFRPSTVDGGQGSIFYQVIHNRVARQQKTGYRLYGYEWNSHSSEVVLPKFNESRKRYLSEIGDKIRMDVKHFQKVIADFEHSGCDYTADDVIAEFASDNPENFLFPFMEGVIANLKTLGKIRTSETYAATLCSFRRFREDKDVPLDDMDSDMMMAYEAYLKNNGVSPNSSSFYMRNLRAVYNRAVEKGLTSQRFPFKHVYTGVDKTVKRAVPLKVIKRIKEMDFSMNPSFDFARDMFLMSFYTRGMSFVDMAYLRKRICRMVCFPIADARPGNNCSLNGRNVCRRLWISTILRNPITFCLSSSLSAILTSASNISMQPIISTVA